MQNRPTLLVVATLLVTATFARPGQTQGQTDWNAPFPPHKVIDNVYFIGTNQLGSFLITTPEGHILINSDFESTVPFLRKNVEALGFRFTDIRIILGSHAHGDHMEGDAMLKELTAGQVMAMEEDVPALRAMRPGGKPHPIDRILHDGDTVQLGGETLTAYRTPGHTKGNTSWWLEVQDGGRTYNALVVGSFGVNANYRLVNNPDYPNQAQDYMAMFKRVRSLPVDVFLGSHGRFYGLAEKYEKLKLRKPGDPNPFIDRAGYLAHIDLQEGNFQKMLKEQTAAAR